MVLIVVVFLEIFRQIYDHNICLCQERMRYNMLKVKSFVS